MKFKVKTWYDTITSESAQNSDYASLGNDMREREYDDLDDAVNAALEYLNGLNNEQDLLEFRERLHDHVVLYSSDPVTDYTTGDADMHTACIEVIHAK